MTLTAGAGIFGHAPAGQFNIEIPIERLLLLEPYPRRMRATIDGEAIVDSHRGMLLYESGVLPRLYFPTDEVRMDLLEPAGERGSELKGRSQLWRLRVGEREVDEAAISHPEPPPGAPPIADLICLRWSAIDEWLEEDEVAIAHVRDPYHRVDVLPTSRRVVVRLGDTVLADSARGRVLYETGLPPRWYVPRDDVLLELEPSELHTQCAYKGSANYWSLDADGDRRENLAWTYRDPRHDAAEVRDLVAFFNEQVEIEVDGELQPQVMSPWSAPDWWKRFDPVVAEL